MSYLGPISTNAYPVINYISNGRAIDNTLGWNTYADAAGAQPVDGTGGVANITWNRDLTSPLRGIADFTLVKDAVNRQGQGVSEDFTIDNADLAKVLTISFDYEVVSGTYATGDLAIYLIQDPAGTPVVIQPAGYQVQSATAGTKMKHIATFQTASNITSYRLCIHVASTSASAYTLAIDNVVVGPQTVQYGAPVTDWQDYTPVVGWTGATTIQTAKWRRVGDSAEIFVRIAAGTSSGNARIGLPPGLVVANLSTTQVVGFAALGFNQASSSTFLASSGNAFFQLGTQWSSGNGLTPDTGFAGQTFSGFAKIPILGWSSSVQMSNDTDTRVVAASVSTGTGVNANNTAVQVPFGSTIVDTHGGIGTNQYTVPVPGLYRVVAQTRTSFPSSNVSFNHSLSIFKNGVSAAQEAFQGDGGNASGLYWMLGTVNQIIRCNAGDVLTVVFGTNYNAGNSNTSLTMFSAERLSGPSAIAASETVAASYRIAAAVTSNTTTPINFATRIFDTHGAVTTGAGWKFTAPISGKYKLDLSGIGLSSIQVAIYVFKNGVSVSNELMSSTTTFYASCVYLIDLVAGDYVDIRHGVNATTGTQGQIHIHRIGN